MWASSAAVGSWRRRWVYLDSRPSLIQVVLNTMAVSAEFILYKLFSSFLTRAFSLTARLERSVPKDGSVESLAGAGYLEVLEVLEVVCTDVSIDRSIILMVVE